MSINSGLVARDNSFTNLSVSQILTSVRTVTGSLISGIVETVIPPQIIILVEIPTATATYSLAPSHSSTIYRFHAPLQTNTGIHFDIDSSGSTIGDEMTFLFKSDIISDTTLFVPSPPFYVTQCGGLITDTTMNANGRIALTLMFDGDMWIYTGDNC